MAAVCFVAGMAALSANPQRFTNQSFALGSLTMAGWFLLVCQAIRGELLFSQHNGPDPLLWFRANGMVFAFFLPTTWLVKEALIYSGTRARVYRRAVPWFLWAVSLAVLCTVPSFVFRDAAGNHQRGAAYLWYTLGGTGAYLILVCQIFLQTRRQKGIRRVEMQFLALNMGVSGLLAILATSMGNLLHIISLKRTSLFIPVAAYSLSTWAMTYHRVFDVRQVFWSLGQRTTLLIFTGSGTFLLTAVFDGILAPLPALIAGLALCSSAGFWLDRRSREWLGISSEKILERMRQSVIGIARTEPDLERLRSAFQAFLCEHCQTGFVALHSAGEPAPHPRLALAAERPAHTALCQSGWATPETLQRRRSTLALDDLRDFLADQSLGLMIAVPRGSTTPSLLLGFGVKANEWPYTYPEVHRLESVAELMDNILTRSRLTTQAALESKMEQLSMMSRGLAHDLNNLITPISSFLVHTDGRFPADSPEQEVHTAARQSMQVMRDYINEASFFAKQLAPRFETIRGASLLAAARNATTARATHRQVALSFDEHENCEFVGDAVLLQRLLANLVVNAIDASAAGTTVLITLRKTRSGWFCIRVADQGCGIPPANLGRIFEPYFTTKEFGDEIRGFGLGLTICQKIAELHHGAISVQSEVDRGTTFTVDLPLKQPAASAVRK
jgi:signal transduction histidine kinase